MAIYYHIWGNDSVDGDVFTETIQIYGKLEEEEERECTSLEEVE